MAAQFLLVTGLYSALLGSVGHLVNKEVPQPYMDEIFHVRQAQHYCARNFTVWDPKITTLPGLYLLSVGTLEPASLLCSWLGLPLTRAQLCSLPGLRAGNLLLSLVNLVLIHSLTGQLHGAKVGYSERLGLWSSVNIALNPVLWFFSFLYYTDPASTALVMLTVCLAGEGRAGLASLAGALSILCRQSNIVWVFLCGACRGGTALLVELRALQSTTRQPPTLALSLAGQAGEAGRGLALLVRQPAILARTVGHLLLHCWQYLAVGAAFLAFLSWNGGIVVGDRAAHTASLHLMQLGYFGLFYTGLTLPWLPRSVREGAGLARRYPAMLGAGLGACLAAAHYCSPAHPYLLADNRHYTFYLWRWVVARHWSARYLLAPAHLLGLYHAGQSLARADLVMLIALPLCTAISTVPQLLLEFRYFIVPFILLRARLRPDCPHKLAAETAVVLAVNTVTIYLFLYRPFRWESEPDSLQRFMW